jgi:hypothetical protein
VTAIRGRRKLGENVEQRALAWRCHCCFIFLF